MPRRAFSLVAGQGYLQLAFIALSPLFLIFVIGNRIGLSKLARRFGLAIVLGAMIAAPFLVPSAHFLPSFDKLKDPDFVNAQPFWYVPTNLIIDSYEFYRNDNLGKQPIAYLYINYLGWIALILATVGCWVLWRRRARSVEIADVVVIRISPSLRSEAVLAEEIGDGAVGVRQ